VSGTQNYPSGCRIVHLNVVVSDSVILFTGEDAIFWNWRWIMFLLV